MQVHETNHPRTASTLSPEALRAEFLLSGLFQPGAATFHYWETDRTIVGGIVPGPAAVALPNPPEVRSAFFLERREAGVINLGGAGTVTVDGATHALEPLDGLYLGRGTQAVSFASRAADQPAKFYFLSYPAHAAYPVKH
ncbi:MAG: 5-dehydro-4-deoxy-D-glucuronate isomerase, partial [Opitutae bacterium]